MPDSKAYPGLGKPGGPGLFGVKGLKLPAEIEAIAKHLHYEAGRPKSIAIAIAVSQCKRICATGRSNVGQVNAAYRAKCCANVAEWEKSKALAHSIPNKRDTDHAKHLILKKG